MYSNPVLVVGVLLVFLTAGCLGTVQSSPVAAGDAGNATISVAATAETSASPDLAVVRLAVVATAPDAGTARSQVAANVSRMRSALEGMGVGDDRIRTTYFHLAPVYEPTDDGRDRTVAGYRAAHGFEVETDAGRPGAVIDAATANGANRIDGVEFTLAEDTRRELRAEALRLAMVNAREDADSVANASGIAVEGVESVSTADVRFASFDARLAEGGDAGASTPTVIEPGPVAVSATVSVTYRAG